MSKRGDKKDDDIHKSLIADERNSTTSTVDPMSTAKEISSKYSGRFTPPGAHRKFYHLWSKGPFRVVKVLSPPTNYPANNHSSQ